MLHGSLLRDETTRGRDDDKTDPTSPKKRTYGGGTGVDFDLTLALNPGCRRLAGDIRQPIRLLDTRGGIVGCRVLLIFAFRRLTLVVRLSPGRFHGDIPFADMSGSQLSQLRQFSD
jgi:hypothetical protein